MTTLYIGAAGTILFLTLTIISLVNKRLKSHISVWKYPLFVLPLLVFAWILSTQLYIPFKGNGCSYAARRDFIQPEQFSVHKKSGILLLFIEGFGDCQAKVTMNSGKTYTTKSLNGILGIILPADSGRINDILLGGPKGDTLAREIKFVIQPGKLTYLGSFVGPGGLSLLLPAMACKAANFTYQVPEDNQYALLKSWTVSDRLVLTSAIKDRLAELRENQKEASLFIGLQFGYRPFNSTSLNGKVQSMSPGEVMNDYNKYAFLLK